MDYTDLNDACPKDNFPLPRIDQIVDSSTGHGLLSFLDAFSGYHQIPMHSPDAKKTSFINPHGLYCYNVMPFGLKNAGATYQRLVTKMFYSLLESTMEANDTLYLYLAASDIAISVALFKECGDAKLRPVSFVSKSLIDAETRYSHLE